MAEQEVPIKTVHLFPLLDRKLIELLKSLSADDWNKPTLAKLWTVKDIAAHLLDGNIRVISSSHQFAGDPPSGPVNSYSDLVDFLNGLNAAWVKAMRRVSPQLLTDFLETTGKQYSEIMARANLFAPAPFSVAWAGEEHSINWFHIAREYTEKFHHQQQIREAVGKQGILTAELFYPCIDTFMRGLPHAYRTVMADAGALIEITVTGEAGGNWYLLKTAESWILTKNAGSAPDTIVALSPDIAWKVFTKGINPQTALEASNISGNINLGENLFNMVAVMA
ncbi:maleylpyruvate isomerase N-terminal domain-containing protein [Mucilaginibacter sp. cycad4]|uniref:maleylpyruvate isomerase N-terminal domain-containing protein n=1 Tax=Mucilaginibacter sp. cycad4 TaxID=3342096 RepID=UPI002AABB30D|nr:maleylpyruvate isomerase N-terminal domain-containing protein [Mucilaginibacter gossypii]WPV02302.1 maleylpyruvate isomerase N-terminal domain-containing protein [Mucilaginibacter gossypii]